jgi:hypothetical protein
VGGYKMNKLIVVLLFLFSLMFVVSGVSAEGFTNIDEEIITNDTYTFWAQEDVKTTHIRDNYDVVTYTNGTAVGSTTLHVKTIEIDDGGYVTDTDVYEWTYDTAVMFGRRHWVESFNKTSGLFTITFVQSYSSNQQINTFSMIMNSSGEVHWTGEVLEFGGSSLQKADGGKIINTNDENDFIFATYEFYNGGTYTWGGTLLEDGSFDLYQTQSKHCSKSGRFRDFLRINGECSVYLYDYTTGYYRYTEECSSNYMAGGGASICGSTAKGSLVLPLGVTEPSFIENSFMNVMLIFYGEALYNDATVKTLNYAGSVLNTESFTEYGIDNTEIFPLDTNAYITLHTYEGAFDTTEMYLFTFDNDGNANAIDIMYYDDLFIRPQISEHHSDDYYVMSYIVEDGSESTIMVRTIATNASIIASPMDTHVTLMDEATLEPFNMTDKILTFYAHCADNINFQDTITTNNESIEVTCNYDSFSIKVGYELEVGGTNITYSYKRYYIRELDPEQPEFDLDVYLVDPLTTDYVENEFKLDYFTDRYDDSEIYFEKNIDGLTTQITADMIDIRNSVRAVLMNGETYYIYLKEPNGDKNYIGEYLSPQAGVSSETTTLNLFDIGLTPTTSRILNQFDYQIYGDKETGLVNYIVQTIDGVDNNLLNMSLTISDGTTQIYNDTKGSETYNESITPLYALFSEANINLSAYRNDTLSFEMLIAFVDDGELRYKPYKGNLWIQEEISVPMMDYLNDGFMDWVILVLLSVVAIYATYKTANMVAIVIVVFAALFSMFGWFTISSGTLGLAIFVCILSLLTNKRSDYP